MTLYVFLQTIDTPAIRTGLLQGLAGNTVDLDTVPSVSGLFRSASTACTLEQFTEFASNLRENCMCAYK